MADDKKFKISVDTENVKKAFAELKSGIGKIGDNIKNSLEKPLQTIGKVGSAALKGIGNAGSKAFKGIGGDAKKSLDDVNKKLKDTGDQAKETSKATGDLSSNVKSMKDSMSLSNIAANGLGGAMKNLTTGFKLVIKQMWLMVANPIGAILSAIVAVAGALYLIFKDFGPLLDKIDQQFAAVGAAVNKVKNAFQQFIAGNASLKDSFKDLGDEMVEAAKAARELKAAEQELGDATIIQAGKNAQNRAEINKLILASKDLSKSDAERIKINDEVTRLEQENFDQNKKLVEEEIRIAQENIINKRDLTEEEKGFIRDLNLEKIKDLKNLGRFTEKEEQILTDMLIKRVDLEDKTTAIIEKANNRRAALSEAEKRDQQSAIDKKAAANAKADDDKIKATENNLKLLKLKQEEYDKEKVLVDGKKDEDYIKKIKENLKIIYAAEVAAADEKLKLGKINSQEHEILVIEAGKREKSVVDKINADILDSEKKYADEQKAINDKKLADDAKLLEEEKKLQKDRVDISKYALDQIKNDEFALYEDKIKILKDYYDKSIELAELNGEDTTLLRKEQLQAENDLYNEHLSKKQNQALEGIAYINNLDEQATQFRSNLLANQLKSGKINQEDYDKSIKEIEIKAAKRKKAYAIAETIVNTAASIMGIWKDVPKVDYGISAGIISGAVGLLGAAQIATIASTPIDGAGGSIPSGSIPEGGANAAQAPSTSFTFDEVKPQQAPAPVVKTYVVSSDIRTQDQLDRKIIGNGTI